MATIIDVAKLAGVSTATVSRVINSPGTVSESTREKVHQAMVSCNYTYNALARGFVTKKSNTIGLIIPNINNPVFAESTRGVQDYADNHNVQVILGNTYYQQHKEEDLIRILREKQVDGLIITSTDLKGPTIRSLVNEKFPFVLLYSTIRTGPMFNVGVDNYRGGYLATEHLVQLGHRRIGMVAGKFTISDRSYHRWHGYRQCLRHYGIAYDQNLLVQTEYSLAGGKASLKSLYSLREPPTAVFCSNDYLALGAMNGARECGLQLPEDMSIVGFDDTQIASYVFPGLTTVHQPAYDMGTIGAMMLLDRIAGQMDKPVHRLLETELVVRESTAQPGKKCAGPIEGASE